MAPRTFVGLLLLLAIAGPLAAQQPWVDPRLRLLETTPAESRLEAAGAERGRPAPEGRPGQLATRGPLSLRPGPGGRVFVGLLVEMRDPSALSELRAAGAEIGTVVGRIATVHAPADALGRITQMASLVRIQAARPFRLHNDSAASASRVDEVRQRDGATFRGTTGRGVAVGIIDTGLDPYHPDFYDELGEPRIVALWDQASNRFCDTDRIRARTCQLRDVNGHGTHVAGTAAGNGRATGGDTTWLGRFAGVAPEASILGVRFSFMDDLDLVDGVAWMFGRADSMGVPAVVNISLGSHFGPHDGTSLLEQALDSLSGPGRIIVASAGNEGNAPNTTPELLTLHSHSRATLGAGQTALSTFRITSYSASANACSDYVLLDLWYDGDQELAFEVIRPDQSGLTVATGGSDASNDPDGRIVIIAPAEPDPGNGDRNAIIEISGCDTSGSPATGVWTLRITAASDGDEPLDLWIAGFALGSQGLVLGETNFDSRYVVGMPATAEQVIAVGAYASRVCWPTPNAASRCLQDVYGFSQPVGDIAFFSSAGPSRDERLKPEIAAPGMVLMSSKSSATSIPAQLQGPTGQHRVEMGTSMSAPHVAGAVALLLQHAPGLTPDSVRALLAASAATDNFTNFNYATSRSGLPNTQWGHGKLDIRAALELLVDPTQPVALYVSARVDTMPVGAVLPLRAFVVNAFGDSIAPATLASEDPGVARVEDGEIVAVELGSTTVRATGSGFEETVLIEVVPPARLVLDAEPLSPPGETTSRAGTRLPLLDLELVVDGHEGVLIDTLGFSVRGRDAAARLLLVEDRDDDGELSAGEPVIADTTFAVDGEITVLMTPDIVVPANDTLDVIAALELSGAVPHGSEFQLVFLPERTSSIGIRSGAPDVRSDPESAVASATSETTLLEPDEIFTLSENPLRSDARRLVLSFAEEPTLAGIYTLRGARVVDLLPRLDPGGLRVDWDLRTDGGGMVAPGVYFLVVRVAGQLVREKLIVARGYGGSDE